MMHEGIYELSSIDELSGSLHNLPPAAAAACQDDFDELLVRNR